MRRLYSTSTSPRLGDSISYWQKRVLYVDRGVIVLNKPSGLICQTQGNEEFSSGGQGHASFNECLNSLRQSLSLSSYPYPVHRLDKGTTGTLLLAKTLQSAQNLSQQFQHGTVEKIYLALVRGGDKSFPMKSGMINVPLQYHEGFTLLEHTGRGKPSLTEWEVVASSPVVPLTLMRLRLLTGRKHQLRVHMAQCLRAPVLGDHIYSKTAQSNTITSFTRVPDDRIYLHAHEMSFLKYRASGPHKRFRLGIRAPIPQDFLRICADTQIKTNSLDSQGGILVDRNVVQDGQVPEVGGYWYKDI